MSEPTVKMSVKEARQRLTDMETELAAMGGHDRSGYLPFEISRFKEAIEEFDKTGGKNNEG